MMIDEIEIANLDGIIETVKKISAECEKGGRAKMRLTLHNGMKITYCEVSKIEITNIKKYSVKLKITYG